MYLGQRVSRVGEFDGSRAKLSRLHNLGLCLRHVVVAWLFVGQCVSFFQVTNQTISNNSVLSVVPYSEISDVNCNLGIGGERGLTVHPFLSASLQVIVSVDTLWNILCTVSVHPCLTTCCN